MIKYLFISFVFKDLFVAFNIWDIIYIVAWFKQWSESLLSSALKLEGHLTDT